MTWILIAVVAIIILVAVATVGLAVLLARRVVMPRAAKLTTIRGVDLDAGTITLEADRKTSHAGKFGLWTDGDGHALVGDVVRQDEADGSVTRQLLEIDGEGLSQAAQGRWTGHVLRSPAVLGRNDREVLIPVDGGTAPAWLIEPEGTPSTTWAIHIHGVRTTRITALRTVPAADQLGMTSLVVSFRSDTEGPDVANGASMLGTTEWPDVDAAITYALEQGAERVILFAWSMGASIALLLTERSQHRAAITGLVLVAPSTDWRAVIRHGARKAHLPRFLASAAAAALGGRLSSRIVGLPSPIDLDALDWTRSTRLQKPTLVIHSDGDTEIPVSLSRAFAAANPRQVTLVEINGAEHAWEYNLNPELFNSTITGWVHSTTR
ncbi:alpha/beta hydrolase family protein [Leifsonia sp. NPDC014704]|uniref:Alpha/beta hydrolase n=1 Tax=Leifsonia virtsii TaxID=3035915 RepID=A0ABT8J2H7_9MICO|nr:alpha/beta fold hydrolase [Leifsonia virtsii]MDN4599289.1 alpha/beta hydrolase [Leifsonia virtsii]